MATILKKTFVTTALLCAGLVLILHSCNTGDEKGVWIPVPPDTSALGKKDHFIPMAELEKFRAQYGVERDSLARKAPTLSIPTAEAFNKKALIEILKDPRCVGIRVYYGVKQGNKSNELRLILVGVDEQGKDLYITKGNAAANQTGGGGKGGTEYGQCTPPCFTDTLGQ